jgi:hypothetical protein
MRQALAACALLVCAGAAHAQGGGTGTLYVGTYAKTILVIDEATMRIRDTIRVNVGIPMGMQLSADKKRFYVTDPGQEHVEILDIATGRSLKRFSLSQGTTKVRMWGVNIDPLERYAVLLIKTYTRRPDRYVVGKPTLVRYDLAKGEVTDTIPWPRGEEREGAQIIFSPNGEFLYFFTQDDVLVYDAATLKQVDRWELSRTLTEEGMGRLSFGFPNDPYEEPGFYTGLFRVTDPVNRRTLMGVARMNLMERRVEYFYTFGPSQPVSFRLAPGKTRAFGLVQQVGNYQFWTFDLAQRRVVSRVEFAGRPRMGLQVSSNGSQLYIGVAGATIDRYDARTFQHLGTLVMPADMSGWVLIPAETSRAASR